MNFIVDDIGTVVEKMRSDAKLRSLLLPALCELNKNGLQDEMPYYMYGHRVEISNRLILKDANSAQKYQKYPLVALRLDTPEKNRDGMIDYTLNIAIVMSTNRNWTADDRYTKVFKPVLYPLYESFLKQLNNSGLFTWSNGLHKRPKHTKIDRPYWGTTANEGNASNLFNDPLDAIELVDLELSQTLNC